MLAVHLGRAICCMSHGLRRGQLAPGVGSEMIATENESRFMHPRGFYKLKDKFAELCGAHSGLPAELVHLIAGRLHAHH